MSDSMSVPPMIRQGQLVEEIARSVAANVTDPWNQLVYRISSLARYQEDLIYVTKVGAEGDREFPPRDIYLLINELRAVMYRPGLGTWFSAEWKITPGGTVDVSFNFDEEPEFEDAVPAFYTQDLEKFPRDEVFIPEWLQTQLDLDRRWSQPANSSFSVGWASAGCIPKSRSLGSRTDPRRS